MVNREGPNSPRVSSDLGVNLKDQRHPIRDRIGSSLPVRPGKDAGEATMAVKRETGTKRSAVNNTPGILDSCRCRGGVPAAGRPGTMKDIPAAKRWAPRHVLTKVSAR